MANLVKAPMQLLTIIFAMSYGFLATEDSDPILLKDGDVIRSYTLIT